MRDALAGEWRKTRSASSTRYVLGVVALFAGLMCLLAVFFVATWDGLPPEGRAASSLGSLTDLMGWVLSLVLAVFGALSIASEYASGMIRTTFIAMPNRAAVLAAKAAIVAAVAFCLAEVALIVVRIGVGFIVGDRPITGQTAPALHDVGAIIATGLATTMFALLGLSLGAITRSALASIVALAVVWYVAPLLAQRLPPPWADWLMSLLPGALAGQLAGTGNANSIFASSLPPWLALVAMVGYALVPLAAATRIIDRRDV